MPHRHQDPLVSIPEGALPKEDSRPYSPDAMPPLNGTRPPLKADGSGNGGNNANSNSSNDGNHSFSSMLHDGSLIFRTARYIAAFIFGVAVYAAGHGWIALPAKDVDLTELKKEFSDVKGKVTNHDAILLEIKQLVFDLKEEVHIEAVKREMADRLRLEGQIEDAREILRSNSSQSSKRSPQKSKSAW